MMSGLSGEGVSRGEEDQLLKKLEKLTTECGREESCRFNLDPQIFLEVDIVLTKHVANDETCIVEDAFPIVTQILRFLRNAVAACKPNQDFIREKTDIILTSNKVLDQMTDLIKTAGDSTRFENYLVVARCTLQFLMNFMVNNLDNVDTLISLSTVTSISQLFTTTQDEKIIEYAAMNFHTFLKQKPDIELDIAIIPVILGNTHLEFMQYGANEELSSKMGEIGQVVDQWGSYRMYVIETLATNDQFLRRIYPGLSVELRVKFIRVIVAHTELHDKLPPEITTFFSDEFKQKSDLILKSQLQNDDWMAWEIASLLELLCCLSALDQSILKADVSLLTTVIFLLKSVHSVSKADPGSTSKETLDFSSVTNIDAMTGSEEMRDQPTFQFKAHLIRLTANLIYRNFANQEMVREMEVLPVILDSCNIDARNPFITQWAVLAIRNACEGNTANQELVRSVQQIDTKDKLSKVQLVGL
ncbi:Ataxin-10 [Folsomia candida]|uniref:Ataxin-10 n=1 Tax=Folsomia candida TaxID=158441 RepID=A0A226EPU2_FOLCA|nr:Ataxin-10 [Folsomia candida]